MITKVEMEFYETLIREIPKISKGIKELTEQVKELKNDKSRNGL
tara:strand:- start:3970 stop:4101 length:132 start_codon:yes stop_codon:yes gene_type:complete